MGDEHDGLVQLVLQVQQQHPHVRADQRIERTEGLVHQQDVCIGRERAGEADALLHTAGEVMRIGVFVALQADPLDPPRRAVGAFALGKALKRQAVTDVVHHGPVREQRKALEHHADLVASELLQRCGVEREHVLAVHADFAFGRVDETVDMADQGGLAGAAESHDDLDAARGHVQIDVAQSEHVTVVFQQFLLADAFVHQRHHGRRVGAEHLVEASDVDARLALRGHDCRCAWMRRP